MGADVQGGLIVANISNKGNFIVFAAFHAPPAPVQMGFVVMVMVSLHRTTRRTAVTLLLCCRALRHDKNI